MKRPSWQFSILRDTDAPFAMVRKALLNGGGYGGWHPRHKNADPEVIEDDGCLEILCRHSFFGIQEEARYRVDPRDGRLLLAYTGKFRGWPVLPMMGWWRIKSEGIWERFVASLPTEEE